jgi:hypothetical protein
MWQHSVVLTQRVATPPQQPAGHVVRKCMPAEGARGGAGGRGMMMTAHLRVVGRGQPPCQGAVDNRARPAGRQPPPLRIAPHSFWRQTAAV